MYSGKLVQYIDFGVKDFQQVSSNDLEPLVRFQLTFHQIRSTVKIKRISGTISTLEAIAYRSDGHVH